MLLRIVQTALYFPILFLLFWSVQIAGFLYYVHFLDFRRPRSDLFNWARMMSNFFRVKYYRIGSQTLKKEDPCIYLCNHRSWSDFFVEHYVTNGRSAAISRMMVFVALPVFMTYGYVSKSMFFFRRNAINDKEKFNRWLDKCIRESPFKGLIVYPEGHRNDKDKSLPLKKGMLRFAYLRKIPCQIVIGKNKEKPFSEKHWRVQFGCEVYVAYSQIIQPGDFDQFEDFFKEVQTKWYAQWATVFSTNSANGLELLEWKEPEGFEFSFPVRLFSAMAMIAGMVLLPVVLYEMARVFVFVLRFCSAVLG